MKRIGMFLLFLVVSFFPACDNDTTNDCEVGQVFVDGYCRTECKTNTDCFNAGHGGFVCKEFDDVNACVYDVNEDGISGSNDEQTCYPTTEVCNGHDDDCDGQVDENVKNACGKCGDLPTEVCDGVDNDCDGNTDEGLFNACGKCGPVPEEVCNGLDDNCDGTVPAVEDDDDLDGWRVCEGDCNDKVPGIHPEAEELCDGYDNNCDGMIPADEADEDNDGYRICDGDCNDHDASRNPEMSELCDGKDNNCDGETDEGYFVGVPCNGIGACGAGVFECFGTLSKICSTMPEASEDESFFELCSDNVDNDCDGSVDEGCSCDEGDFQPCGTNDFGQCQIGWQECLPGGIWGACEGSVEPTPEVCNGFDDDCDQDIPGAEVDQDGDGQSACAGDCNEADPLTYFGAPEICNGADDDCDGEVDEDFFVNIPCTGLGACGAGVYQCNGEGEYICSTMPGGADNMSVLEICADLIDNDCDGSVDEDCECDPLQNDVVKKCGTSDVGQCVVGEQVCGDDFLWGVCVGAINPEPEMCDGKDNDCDGVTPDDEVDADGDGFMVCEGDCNDNDPAVNPAAEEVCNGIDDNCSGGLPDEGFFIGAPCNGVGACGVGHRECFDELTTVCSTDIGGSADQSVEEICTDFVDNDCDGEVNDGCTCVPGYSQNCGQSNVGECVIGSQICQENGTWGDCLGKINPALELCDGLDNDCDGQVDNSFLDLGQLCEVGTGECSAGGSMICSDDGITTVCNAVANQPQPEFCDGLDNDCDGLTDEDFFVGAPCTGLGECGPGVLECLFDGTGTTCSTNMDATDDQSSPEVWDDLDNDCDGEVDEDFDCRVNDHAFCGTNIGQCKMGYKVCQNGFWSDCFEDVPPETEICDGLDNDCDMQVDEGLLNVCGECGEDPVEVCDGQDNDCDGQVDEGFINLGEPCDVGLGQCRATGTFVCSEGQEVCSVTPGQPDVEICDGLDNDCDGLTDEDLGLGVQCQALGICATQYGQLECDLSAPGGVACSTRPGGSEDLSEVENCGDNLDNDCDGDVDSLDSTCECDSGLEAECGTSDVGECTLGIKTCIDGVWSDCIGNQEPTAEVCDGLDNDCDGFVMTGEWDLDNDGQMACQGDCDDNDSSMKSGASEVCDGKDNDCDGVKDNGFYIGAPCRGFGACGSGTFECATLVSFRCSTMPDGSEDASSEESCNGLVDEDCDGTVNEGCVCTSGETRDCGFNNNLPCVLGNQICVDGQWGDCVGAIIPTPEKCDGFDNDCDGVVPDNEVDNDGDGEMVCDGDCNDNDFWVNTSAMEICDWTVDNDCDGQIDEGLFVGSPCNGVGACGIGVWECTPLGGIATIICNTEPGASDDQSIPEICGNNIDDDCNGQVDDGCLCDPGTLAECGPGTEVGICTDGIQTCAGDGLSWGDCVGAVFPLDEEVCNGKDDNCDNLIPVVERDVDGDGYRQCAGDCNDGDDSVFPGANEVCDGQDNDCDGLEDEGCDYVQCNICCGFGFGSPVVWWGGDPVKSWFGEGYCDTWTGTVQQICERGEYPIQGYENDGWIDWNCNIGNQWGGWTNAGVQWCVNQNGVAVNYEVVSGQVDPQVPAPEGEVIMLDNVCPQ